ncbi:MAG: type II secretion system protein GspD, partial [Terriglobales bacterium]
MRAWRIAAAAALLGLMAAAAAPAGRSAQDLFRQALSQARSGHADRAYLLAAAAARAQPQKLEYGTVRELLRQRATLEHLERAHGLQLARRLGPAATEFRTALALDPDNVDAHQGLAAIFALAPAAKLTDTELRVRGAASAIAIEPRAGTRDFQIRGTLRQAIGEIAGAFGLQALVADSVPERSLRLDLTQASFAEAMAALHDMAGVDWIALDAHTLYWTESSQLRAVAPVALRTFYLPWVADPLELNEIANVAKSLLELRQATADAGQDSISVRATAAQLDATERLLLDLRGSTGEVVLEVRILDVNASAARDLGVAVPDQFTMFALGPLLAELGQNAGLSQEILNLFQQGGLNAVLNSGQLGAGALGALQQQISPLLQNPFVVFGGGATLMALSVPSLSAQLSAQSGRVTSLETALLRAQSGQTAELKVGEKFPVINASFSPISLSPAIAKVIGNGTFIQPFPSFTYEDLGLDAKMTPQVGRDGNIRLQVDITENALAGASTNNIPILSSRHLLSAVSLRNNEPVVLAGLFTRQEMDTLSGLPGLAQIPGFGRIFSVENRQRMQEQLMLVVTPHVVKLP